MKLTETTEGKSNHVVALVVCADQRVDDNLVEILKISEAGSTVALTHLIRNATTATEDTV